MENNNFEFPTFSPNPIDHKPRTFNWFWLSSIHTSCAKTRDEVLLSSKDLDSIKRANSQRAYELRQERNGFIID